MNPHSPVVIGLLFQEKVVQMLTSGWFHCISYTLRSTYKVWLVICDEDSFVVADYQQEWMMLARYILSSVLYLGIL